MFKCTVTLRVIEWCSLGILSAENEKRLKRIVPRSILVKYHGGTIGFIFLGYLNRDVDASIFLIL